jgi:hypothetical protein
MRIGTAGLVAVLALAAVAVMPASEGPPILEKSTAFSSAPVTPMAVSIDSVEQLQLVVTVSPAFAGVSLAIAHLDSTRIQSVIERSGAIERLRATRYAARTMLSHPSTNRHRSNSIERSRRIAQGRTPERTPVLATTAHRREV